MRRLLKAVVFAVLAAAISTPALAGNQEVANEIAKNLRDSGQLSNYKIEVKYQKGTAWLKGQVQDEAQMNSALRLTLDTNEVSRVVNDLTVIASSEAAASTTISQPLPAPPQPAEVEMAAATEAAPAVETAVEKTTSPKTAAEWLKKVVGGEDPQPTPGEAERVASSFTPAPARQVTAVQPVAPSQPVAQPMPQAVGGRPIPVAYTQNMGQMQAVAMQQGAPIPAYAANTAAGAAPASYDQPNLPNYAWPSYASYPNYAALTYPRQYSPTAWPYIGPFYPYPQVPLGWRKVTLEWDDGWWMLDFDDSARR